MLDPKLPTRYEILLLHMTQGVYVQWSGGELSMAR